MTTDSVRDTLVQAGVELIEESETTDISLRAIARRAGVSHGAPRHWFPTHQRLLAAIAAEGLHDLAAAVRRGAEQGADDRIARAVGAARAYVDFAVDRPAMFALVFRHDLLEGSGARLRDTSQPLFRWWRDTIVAPGGASPTMPDIDAGALRLWTAVHGIATLSSTTALALIAPTADVGDLVDSTVRALMVETPMVDTRPRPE
ncbi:TetR/AcrR family transcriptional regulator [Gordonia soli]|nr:TetR/AcrR family transcriptional regulator [Gordonia soli]